MQKTQGESKVAHRAIWQFVAFLFLSVGINVFGHTGPSSENRVPTNGTGAAVLDETPTIAPTSDTDSPCNNHSQDPDCNACPSGSNCQHQAASLSMLKIFEWDPHPVAWIPSENSRTPANMTFEPALRPPNL